LNIRILDLFRASYFGFTEDICLCGFWFFPITLTYRFP
jgi:hypothetical protein